MAPFGSWLFDEVDLESLLPTSGEPLFGSSRHFLRYAPASSWLVFSQLAAFHISPHLRRVEGMSLGADPRHLEHLLHNNVLPRVAQSLGGLAIHGSAICDTSGKTVACVGPGGSGKSSFALAAHRSGLNVIADDALVFDEAGRPQIGPRSLRVTEASASALGIDTPERSGHKRRFALPPLDLPIELAAIAFLRRGPTAKVENLRPSAAFELLLPNLLRLDATSRSARSRELDLATKLLRQVRPVRVTYAGWQDLEPLRLKGTFESVT